MQQKMMAKLTNVLRALSPLIQVLNDAEEVQTFSSPLLMKLESMSRKDIGAFDDG